MDSINRKLLGTMLKNNPFGEVLIDFASNGEEAVGRAASVSYDLIFMDIYMPESKLMNYASWIEPEREFDANCL